VHNEQIKIDSNADQFGQTIEQLKTLVETFGPMMKGRSLNQGKGVGRAMQLQRGGCSQYVPGQDVLCMLHAWSALTLGRDASFPHAMPT
jgi:hypothetical protein